MKKSLKYVQEVWKGIDMDAATFLLITTFILLIIKTGLATVVAFRAWNHRPARWFVLLVASIVLLNIFNIVQYQPDDERTAYIGLIGTRVVLVFLQIAMLLLLSALFVPQWWQGSRPIIWITLPYAVIFSALLIDLLSDTGIFVQSVVTTETGYRIITDTQAGVIVRRLFPLSWLMHLSILLVAFVRSRTARTTIMLLSVTLVIAAAMHFIKQSLPIAGPLTAPVVTILLLIALAYAVMRTRLIVPIRIALDLALQAMDEAVIVLDQQGHVVYSNSRAMDVGLCADEIVQVALVTANGDASHASLPAQAPDQADLTTNGTLTLHDRRIALTVTPVTNHTGQCQGLLLMGRDVTEIERYTRQLEQERHNLAAVINQLQTEKRERDQLAAVVRQLSLPLIPVIEGVLIMPLIGQFDVERAEDFITVLLQGIERERARLVLIDITGIPGMDAASANGLLRGIQAATLLGARCVLVGIRPEMAETLVALNLNLDDLSTAATLEQALQRELR